MLTAGISSTAHNNIEIHIRLNFKIDVEYVLSSFSSIS